MATSCVNVREFRDPSSETFLVGPATSYRFHDRKRRDTFIIDLLCPVYVFSLRNSKSIAGKVGSSQRQLSKVTIRRFLGQFYARSLSLRSGLERYLVQWCSLGGEWSDNRRRKEKEGPVRLRRLGQKIYTNKFSSYERWG